jgi:cysteine desulfurase
LHEIYLDNAATTPLSKEVADAMAPFTGDRWGNASSVHRRGVAAREAIDRARAQVARAVGASSQRVIFTGSGTEANNLALLGIVRAKGCPTGNLCIGPAEHASVRSAAQALEHEGYGLRVAKLDKSGSLDLEQLAQALDGNTLLMAQMLVSNEFGSIYPTAQVSQVLKAQAPEAWLHVDGVQGLGKLRLSMSELGADSLALSAHKIHGPQGVGALVLARDIEIQPLIFGGGQESGLRSGTENLAGIVGFGCAAQLAAEHQKPTLDHLTERRAQLLQGIEQIEGLRILEFGSDGQQPGILSILVPGAPAEVWLHHLDAGGVIVSVGSACQANKKEISPVLFAAGLDASKARQVLRISIGSSTSTNDIQQTISIFKTVGGELTRL